VGVVSVITFNGESAATGSAGEAVVEVVVETESLDAMVRSLDCFLRLT
jgi:hypothetical protein